MIKINLLVINNLRSPRPSPRLEKRRPIIIIIMIIIIIIIRK